MRQQDFGDGLFAPREARLIGQPHVAFSGHASSNEGVMDGESLRRERGMHVGILSAGTPKRRHSSASSPPAYDSCRHPRHKYGCLFRGSCGSAPGLQESVSAQPSGEQRQSSRERMHTSDSPGRRQAASTIRCPWQSICVSMSCARRRNSRYLAADDEPCPHRCASQGISCSKRVPHLGYVPDPSLGAGCRKCVGRQSAPSPTSHRMAGKVQGPSI